MNASQPITSRRGFLTALFPDPHKSSSTTGLTTIPELRQQTDAVLWAAAGDSADNIFVAGDDGVVFHFNGEHWQREDLGSKLNVHSLCLSQGKVFSVGWLGRICVRESGVWTPLQGGQIGARSFRHPREDEEEWIADRRKGTARHADQYAPAKTGLTKPVSGQVPGENHEKQRQSDAREGKRRDRQPGQRSAHARNGDPAHPEVGAHCGHRRVRGFRARGRLAVLVSFRQRHHLCTHRTTGVSAIVAAGGRVRDER